MNLEVRWTPEAEYTFDHIVSFIQNGWSNTSAAKFREKTKRTLSVIATQPLSFPETNIDGTRKAVIMPQTTVFYKVFPHYIMLVYFWDNRQNPLFI